MCVTSLASQSSAYPKGQKLESFPELPVFRCIDDLGGTVVGSFRRYIDHAFLGKTGPDDVPRKIPEACLIVGKNSVPDINIET